jgi:small subunit ribosomal protein S6
LATTATREYELVLMLDPEAPDERRDQIVAEARSRIESAGTIKNDTAWGTRKMAFEIQRRTEADYRFFRFESEPPLLESLDHELKIADGVLRFRIFGVDPRSPVVVPPAPTPGGAPPPRGPRRPDADGDEAAPAEAPEEQAPVAEEAPSEDAPSEATAVEPAAPAVEEAPAEAEAAPTQPDPAAEVTEPTPPDAPPAEPETPSEAPETPPTESA